ncbi:MAG: carbon-nitrogen hydrolase family protein [Acetatifactor sp.]|nr:carbon-nitrogen hydrolase family protein [Acetatifactor sp.]
MVKIATTCMRSEYDVAENLAKMMKWIDEAANNGANLIVFPEICLQCYPCRDLITEQEYQWKTAELIPEGESTQTLIRKAKEKNIYIVWGMTELDKEDSYKKYNTNVLVGPEGYIGKYRKVHRGLSENFIWYKSDEFGFNVFDTSIGKIGMCTCLDKAHPESALELAALGAEIIAMPTGWPYANSDLPTEEDTMYRFYQLYDRARAAENSVYWVSSNTVGLNGCYNFVGNSNIVDPSGKIVATTGEAEGIAYYEIDDLQADVYRHRTTDFLGFAVSQGRRPEMYKNLVSEF